MASVYCWDGATGAADGSSWTDAYTTIQAAITGAGTGGTVYLADDHEEALSTAVTLPQAGAAPAIVVSTNRTSGQYSAATAAQFTGTIEWDGSAVFYGLYISGTGQQLYRTVSPEYQIWNSTRFDLNNDRVYLPGVDTVAALNNCTIDVGSSTTSNYIISMASECDLRINGLSFVNSTARTGYVFDLNDNTYLEANGLDLSGFDNITLVALQDDSAHNIVRFDGCAAPPTAPWFGTATTADIHPLITTRYGTTYGVYTFNYYATVTGSTVYRTGGASDGTAHSWLCATTANCNIGTVAYTPWINVVVGSTGSKTFDVYIANNSADLTDTECWLEVEYYAGTNTKTSLASDRNSDIIAAGTAQTDDSSTWNGTTLGYPQKLSVTATLGKAGLCRARVAIGKASATVYVDPLVTVS